MPASNQEPGIFLWLQLEVCDGEVARHLGGGTVNDYQIDRSHGRLGLKPGCKEPGEEFDNQFSIFQNGLHVVSTFLVG